MVFVHVPPVFKILARIISKKRTAFKSDVNFQQIADFSLKFIHFKLPKLLV